MKTASPREILLDGRWNIVFDPRNEGRRAKWYSASPPPSNALPIRVPGCWEEIHPGYDGVAWYWRRFEVPQLPPHGTTLLQFDAVNYFTEVWIDGQYVGCNEGGYTPFSLDATEFVQSRAEHTLVVRVLDPPKDDVGLEGIVLKETPCWREWESFNFGGIWQSVRLLMLPAIHIADCFVQPNPDLDGAWVELDIRSRASSTEAEVTFELAPWPRGKRRPCRCSHKAAVNQGCNRMRFHLPIDNPLHWSPESPSLYELTVTVAARFEDGIVTDATGVRFGLRWFTFQDGRFHLNGEPVFIKGAFHEGLYPMGLVVPPSKDFVVSEFRKAKQAGFNLLRYWQIPIHPMIMDVADEVGVMLCEEPPIEWILQTDRAVRLCEEEVKRLVLRDRNRPSVVMWTILNEGGAVQSVCPAKIFPTDEELVQTPIQKARENLCRLTRQLDPTRLIIDESGGWARCATMYLPGSSDGQPISDVHKYEPAPTPEKVLLGFRALGKNTGRSGRCHVVGHAPVFVSEFGYGSVPDLVKLVEQYEAHGAEEQEDFEHHKQLLMSLREGFREHKMERFFSSISELCTATQEIHAQGNYLQAMAIRANPLATGYVMHAFSAGGCIIGAEAFDMWRNEKVVARTIAEVNRPHLLSVFVSQTAVEGRSSTQAEVVLVNEGKPEGSQPLRLVVKGPRGEQSEVALGNVDVPQGITNVWSGDIPLGTVPGQCELNFILGRLREPFAVGRRTVWVLPRLEKVPEIKIAVLSGAGRETVAKGLKEVGLRCTKDVDGASQIVMVVDGEGVVSLPELERLAAGGKRVLVLASDHHNIKRVVELFGVPGEVRPSRGNWAPVSHYANDSRLLDGLPQDRLLGQTYAEIVPSFCVVPFQDITLAGCFSFHQSIFAGVPTEFWWGSTIMEHGIGIGSVVLCTFRLANERPVARRMLINLLALGEVAKDE